MTRELLPLVLKIKIAFLFLKISFTRISKLSDLVHVYQSAFSQLKKAKNFLFLKKVFYTGGKYYWSLYLPGFPSKSFEYVLNLAISKGLNPSNRNPSVLIIAITKKCGLNCEHCFEWDEINKKDKFTEELINKKIGEYLSNEYFGQIFFSGGEPLNRYALLLSLVKKFGSKCECWVISSGTSFDHHKAVELKQAGLTGMMISLDSYTAEQHDTFRGFAGSYGNALKALENAKKVGLLTALSLCPTKDRLSRHFLDEYMFLAKQLNISFIQIIEPRPEGKFKGKDVVLERNQLQILERFYIEYNNLKKLRDFPLLQYPDYSKRLTGCRAMDWYVYIDTNGDLYPCPFCKQKNQQCFNISTKTALII